MEKLGFVKKYNHKKNFAILLSINLPLCVVGAILLGIFILGINGHFETGFKVSIFLCVMIVIIATLLIVFIVKFYSSRKKDEKLFNDKTPRCYIEFDESNLTLTILGKTYLLNDILSCSFLKIGQYDFTHVAISDFSDNKVLKLTNTFKQNIEAIQNKNKHKKSNVGDLFIYLSDNKVIYLQRVLDVEKTYKRINELIK